MIKTIAFDMNGVIIISKRRRIQGELSKEFNIKKENWIELINPIIDLSSKGKITKKETLIRIRKTLKEDPKKLKKALKTFYKRSFNINKNMLNLSKELKRKGYRIIIISNLGHLAKEVLVENKNMKHFNKKIISCDIGSSKPNKKIFQVALKKSSTNHDEMIFIDNSQDNVKTAKKLGIKSILFKNNRRTRDDLKKLGVIKK